MYPRHPLEFYGSRIKDLGSGSVGEVYLVENDERKYAVKKMEFMSTHSMFGARDIHPGAIRETAVAVKLNHPNIVQTYDIVVEDRDLYLVMEYAERGTLDKNVPDRSRSKKLIYGFLCGAAYMHSMNIIHRDIKPPNVLVSRDGTAKIADFGLARALICSFQSGLTEQMFTLWYRPPEVLYGDTRYGISGDVWSCGCLVYFALTGKHLFAGDDEEGMIRIIEKLLGTPNNDTWQGVTMFPLYESTHKNGEKYPVNIDSMRTELDRKEVDDRWFYLIKRMLAMNPNKRDTLYTILQDPIFDDVRDRNVERSLTSCIESLSLAIAEPSSPTFDDWNRSFRVVVMDWILEVSRSVNDAHFVPEFRTYFIASTLYDTLYDRIKPEKKKLQLYGAACLNLASVYNDPTALPAWFLVEVGNESFTYEELDKLSKKLLIELNYDMVFSTSADFLIEYGQFYSQKVRRLAKGFLYYMVLVDSNYLIKQDKVALLCILLACQYYEEKFKHIGCLDEEMIAKYQLCEKGIQSIIESKKANTVGAMFQSVSGLNNGGRIVVSACKNPILV